MVKGSARARERIQTNKASAASHSTPLYSTPLHSPVHPDPRTKFICKELC